MAYYTISRALKPVATGISRKMKINPRPNLQHEAFCMGNTKADATGVIAHATPHIYPPKESTFAVWVTNASTETVPLKLSVRFVSVDSGLEVRRPIEQTVQAKATGTTELVKGQTPEEVPTVVVSELFDMDDNLLSYDIDWPQPLKHLNFAHRHLNIEVRGQEELLVSAARPVKGLFFTNDGVQWSDNCVDIVPGQTLRILAKGLTEKPKWIYYGIED